MKKLILIPLVIIVITCGLVSCAPRKESDFCFIATAAYGTPDAVEINTLRQFRDEFLLQSIPGRVFVTVYYTVSPPVAGFISEHDALRMAVKEGFVDPLVTAVELTESWWSE